MKDVAIIPAAPPLTKGRAAAIAGCLKMSERGRVAAVRVGADAADMAVDGEVFEDRRVLVRGGRAVDGKNEEDEEE